MSEDIQRTLGRLEAKLDALLNEQRKHEQERKMHDRRLRIVEQDLSKTKFLGSIFVTVAAFIGSILPIFWNSK